MSVTDSKTGRFLSGNNGGPGRPVGARNKLGTAFIEAMQEDFATHGKITIEKVRADRPHEYLKIVAALLPKELHLKDTTLDDIPDDDLSEILGAIRAVRAGQNGAATAGPPGQEDEEQAARH